MKDFFQKIGRGLAYPFVSSVAWVNSKKPAHVSYSFYWFVWFTVLSLIIGVAVKIVVLVFSVEALSNALSLPKSTRAQVPGGDPLIIELSMTFMQIAILILTLVVYPKSLLEQRRILKDSKRSLSTKAYRSFKREYIVFLAVFVLLDVISIGTLVYYKIKTHFTFSAEHWIMIFSILIPTPLAVGSLVWLRKIRLAGEVK